MTKRIVVALGGNAILTKDASAKAQQEAILLTAKQLTAFLEEDVQLIITHGNGPQVGNLILQQQAGSTEKNPAMPLDTVSAMTQGEIGLWMENALNQAFKEANIDADVATIVTRTEVDGNDEAFTKPTKPIGPFYTDAEAKEIKTQNPDWTLVEDSGRGFRRVVPSPKPISIVEADVIKKVVNTGVTLIAAGGGGVPVVRHGDKFEGVEGVIDKDFSAAKLAEVVDADVLIILTAVRNVFINYNTFNQKALTEVSIEKANEYLTQKQFAEGSMKPKVEAAISFTDRTGKPSVITSLDNIVGYLKDGTGTIIVK